MINQEMLVEASISLVYDSTDLKWVFTMSARWPLVGCSWFSVVTESCAQVGEIGLTTMRIYHYSST